MKNDVLRRCAIPGFALLLTLASLLPNQAYGLNPDVKITDFANIGKPGADSIVLQSSSATCRGNDPIIIVTGENVTWYADSAKTKRLAQGNSYWSALLDTTTTFYLTQTINGVESAVTAITIEIVELFLTSISTTPASCGKNDGTITVVAKGGNVRHPLKFRLDDGPYQYTSVFASLSGGTYTFTTQIDSLCWGTIDITVAQQPSPVIATIDSVATHCGNPDGSFRIGAYGGTGSLSYSLNGIDFQTSNWFENLDGGTYTVSVRDDSLCTTSQSVSLKKSVRLQLNTVDATATTCGKSNGQITIGAAVGNGKLTYSLTGLPDQASTVFENLKPGNYQVSARDETGCSDSLIVEVEKGQEDGPCGNTLYIPNSFSPNQDGLNDGWVIFFRAASLQLEELTIFNRWGEVVFYRNSGSIHSGEILWDGTFKGVVLNGLFTYQLRVQLGTGQSWNYRGTVMVF